MVKKKEKKVVFIDNEEDKKDDIVEEEWEGKNIDLRDSILTRPDTYIGNVKLRKRTDFIGKNGDIIEIAEEKNKTSKKKKLSKSKEIKEESNENSEEEIKLEESDETVNYNWFPIKSIKKTRIEQREFLGCDGLERIF